MRRLRRRAAAALTRARRSPATSLASMAVAARTTPSGGRRFAGAAGDADGLEPRRGAGGEIELERGRPSARQGFDEFGVGSVAPVWPAQVPSSAPSAPPPFGEAVRCPVCARPASRGRAAARRRRRSGTGQRTRHEPPGPSAAHRRDEVMTSGDGSTPPIGGSARAIGRITGSVTARVKRSACQATGWRGIDHWNANSHDRTIQTTSTIRNSISAVDRPEDGIIGFKRPCRHGPCPTWPSSATPLPAPIGGVAAIPLNTTFMLTRDLMLCIPQHHVLRTPIR